MEKAPGATWVEHFASLPDPRSERHRWHKLSDILVIAVCAVLCGAERYPAIEDCGQEREAGLRQFLELPGGMPSHDTFDRVLRVWEPGALPQCVLNWVQAVAEVTQGEVGAIDGNARRRSFAKDTGKRALPMVRAWATTDGVGLGQREVDTKSDEITAIPALLELLTLKGCMVTSDAMGCQRAIAQKMVEQGADDVLALKDHQPPLAQAVGQFVIAGPHAGTPRTASAYHEQTDQGHGRVATRGAWIPAALPPEVSAAAWPGSRSSGMVQAARTVAGEASVEPRC